MNFVAKVKAAVKQLTDAIKGESEKELAVRQLGTASALVSEGEAIKKKAKKTLENLGVIKPGTYVPGDNLLIYDSASFTMHAETKRPGTRLDKDLLTAGMLKAGLSTSRVTKILGDATVDNAPATSFKVVQK